MKTSLSKNWAAALVAAIISLAGETGCVSNAQDETPPPPPPTAAVPAENPMAADSIPAADSTPLPPNIYPSSPLAQVIRLIQGGVSEGVVMTYATNSGSTFNLDSDKIIYLKDIGAPDDLVTAMMQRDQVLQSQMAASANQPPPQPAPVSETVATAPTPTEVVVEQTAPVTVEYFYNSLAPYGVWVDIDGYGRCWRPAVLASNPGWQPYGDRGHWVWTDSGWYWFSDYTWGWAPFHYGRWFHHARFGWCWYPDTVWGPSWVTWRYSDDYCGWAPLPPRAIYREGVGFFYNGAVVSVGFDFGLSVGAFTFVHTRDFCDPRPWRHRVESREVTQIFNHTTVINNFDVDRGNRHFINHGIDPEHITRVTHAPIRPVAIHEAPAPDQRGERLGRDGRTLFVNRPHFNDNPPPSGARGNPPRTAPPAPRMGSPYQPPRNGNETDNSPSRRNEPAPVGSEFGGPNRPQGNRGNDNAGQPRRNQPAPTAGQPQAPRPTVGSPYQPPNNNDRNNRSQPLAPRADNSGSPNRNNPTPPSLRPSPPVPVQPPAPNGASTDNRRYPSPRMQQPEPPNPRTNPGNPGGRVNAPAAQPPPHNYNAPATPPAPPVRQPEANRYTPPPQPAVPAQPPQRNYVSPRNEASPPAQSQPSQPSQPSQRSGRDRNQNGQ